MRMPWTGGGGGVEREERGKEGEGGREGGRKGGRGERRKHKYSGKVIYVFNRK